MEGSATRTTLEDLDREITRYDTESEMFRAFAEQTHPHMAHAQEWIGLQEMAVKHVYDEIVAGDEAPAWFDEDDDDDEPPPLINICDYDEESE